MWSAIRLVTTRAVQAGGALSAPGLRRATSRVIATRTTPTGYRCKNNQIRSFAAAAGAGTTKRAASAKTTTKRKTPAAKKKAKKPAAKPKPKKRVRKVLTPEEKRAVEVRNLKKVALLSEPGRLPDSAWTVYVVSHTKGHKMGSEGVGSLTTSLSHSYRALSSSELQQLQETASKNKLANNAAYKAWVESHPAVDIAEANKARNRLSKLSKTRRSTIQDDRQPKRPATSYALFSKSRWATGEFNGVTIKDAARTLASDWKALSASDRKPFEDLAKADLERYEKEVQSVLGKTVRRSTSP